MLVHSKCSTYSAWLLSSILSPFGVAKRCRSLLGLCEGCFLKPKFIQNPKSIKSYPLSRRGEWAEPDDECRRCLCSSRFDGFCRSSRRLGGGGDRELGVRRR